MENNYENHYKLVANRPLGINYGSLLNSDKYMPMEISSQVPSMFSQIAKQNLVQSMYTPSKVLHRPDPMKKSILEH